MGDAWLSALRHRRTSARSFAFRSAKAERFRLARARWARRACRGVAHTLRGPVASIIDVHFNCLRWVVLQWKVGRIADLSIRCRCRGGGEAEHAGSAGELGIRQCLAFWCYSWRIKTSPELLYWLVEWKRPWTTSLLRRGREGKWSRRRTWKEHDIAKRCRYCLSFEMMLTTSPWVHLL